MTPDEIALWNQEKRMINPLHGRCSDGGYACFLSGLAPIPPPLSGHRSLECKGQIVPTGEERRDKRPNTRAAVSPFIEYRFLRKLSGRRQKIRYKIDLHGLNYEGARVNLLHFLIRAHQEEVRFVLVITGKGRHYGERVPFGVPIPGRPGVLWNAVREWLPQPPFLSLVSGYSIAHPRHGGEGALYVRLRATARRSSH